MSFECIEAIRAVIQVHQGFVMPAAYSSRASIMPQPVMMPPFSPLHGEMTTPMGYSPLQPSMETKGRSPVRMSSVSEGSTGLGRPSRGLLFRRPSSTKTMTLTRNSVGSDVSGWSNGNQMESVPF